jgi:hypothetical protein
VLILITAIITVHSQRGRNVIVWSGDKGAAITELDTVTCGSIPTERGPVSTISRNGIGLAVAFLEGDNYHIVAAHLKNTSPDVALFDADLWGAAHFKTKEGYYAREKPIVAETSVPSRDMLRGLATGVKLDSSLDTFMAEGQTTVETRQLTRPDGTKYKVDVIVPDPEAKEAATRHNAARLDMVTSEQRRIRDSALTAKTVPAVGSVNGLVYFRRVKSADFVVFSIKVDETYFISQLPRKKKSLK